MQADNCVGQTDENKSKGADLGRIKDLEIEAGVVNQGSGSNADSSLLNFTKRKWRKAKRDTKHIHENNVLAMLNRDDGEENQQVCDDGRTSRKRKCEDDGVDLSLVEAVKQPRHSP